MTKSQLREGLRQTLIAHDIEGNVADEVARELANAVDEAITDNTRQMNERIARLEMKFALRAAQAR
jgi:hypothetical protein